MLRSTITKTVGGCRVVLDGEIQDTVQPDLAALRAQIFGPEVILDCGWVRRINSAGSLLWCHFIAELSATFRVELVNLSVQFLGYVAMLPGFVAKATVKSFNLPYFCRPCRKAGEEFMEAETFLATRQLPVVTCSSCGTQMDPEMDLEDLLAVLAP